METLTFGVDGMHCGGCVASIKRALGALAGVGSVDVSLDAATAAVNFDPALTSPDALMQAVADAGYAVRADSAIAGPQKTASAARCGGGQGKTGCGCG